MSLVGSLEDLSLGDILQIITLSRKSGALLLRSDEGEGRVVFRDGLVCGAQVKELTPDLRQLMVEGGGLSEADFEAVRSDAASADMELSAALSERLSPERFEGLCRECVERAVLAMFGWASGEFSFEVGDETPGDPFEVVLDAGINAQYLAMEGTRRTDEDTREPEVDADDPASFADVAEDLEGDGDGPSDAFEAVALTTAERIDEADDSQAAGFHTTEEEVEEALEAAISGELAQEAVVESDPGATLSEPVAPLPSAVADTAPAPPRTLAADPGQRPPIVVMADELPILEWVKRELEGAFRRVHIFQKAELAVQRLRQYVSRGDAALVLVSPGLGMAGKSGFREVDALVTRMKKQSPRSSVLWLGDVEAVGNADGRVPCAVAFEAASAAGPAPAIADGLRAGVLAALGIDVPGGPGILEVAELPADPRLAPVVARLSDPATRGEILNVVLDFAAEHFSRVALLALRDGQAMGIAGLGLEAAGGPDDEGLRELTTEVDTSAWLRAVVESRTTVRAPAGEGDAELAVRLGDRVADEAWLSPVISGGNVVAILYCDNLPGGEPLGETPALEVALAKAGEVLEEAMAERARNVS